MPGVDSEVLKLVYQLPADSLVDRRLQNCMVIRRFPALARLPLDRNSESVRPLAPSFAWRLRNRLLREIHRVPPFRPKANAWDRLYYYRIFDFNHPGWKAIRQTADECRDALAGVFDEKALAEILPPASAEVHLDSPIAGASSLKTLSGLAIWWQSFPPSLPRGIAGRDTKRPAETTVP